MAKCVHARRTRRMYHTYVRVEIEKEPLKCGKSQKERQVIIPLMHAKLTAVNTTQSRIHPRPHFGRLRRSLRDSHIYVSYGNAQHATKHYTVDEKLGEHNRGVMGTWNKCQRTPLNSFSLSNPISKTKYCLVGLWLCSSDFANRWTGGTCRRGKLRQKWDEET